MSNRVKVDDHPTTRFTPVKLDRWQFVKPVTWRLWYEISETGWCPGKPERVRKHIEILITVQGVFSQSGRPSFVASCARMNEFGTFSQKVIGEWETLRDAVSMATAKLYDVNPQIERNSLSWEAI